MPCGGRDDADPLLAGFGRASPANVSDADRPDRRQARVPRARRAAVASPARSSAAPRRRLVKAAAADQATPTLAAKHSVEMIDTAKPGEVGVIVMEGSLDVAALGGMMGTAAKSRGMAGMVLDGAVRDVAEIRALGLPVYARSVSPANAVSRYASVANNVPVECAGVTITPGDIIVASEEGVVVVPKDRAAEVLKRAEEIATREKKMIVLIRDTSRSRRRSKRSTGSDASRHLSRLGSMRDWQESLPIATTVRTPAGALTARVPAASAPRRRG